MIELACDCGHSDSTPENSAGGSWSCPKCGRSIQLACAEQLPENAGQGDFDASFTIVDGPDRVGQKILLGGVTSIEIGKLQGKHIHLVGNRVSRNHCKLNRLDFGPSRWEVEDTGSTNGTLINEQRITKQELSPGDILQVGEFQLQFNLVEAPAEAMIDLAAAASDSLAAPAPAPPPPPIPAYAPPPPSKGTRKAHAQGPANTLAYASPQVELQEERPLTECDTSWVMNLRNGARLMAMAAAPVIPAMICFSGLLVLAAPFSAILAGVSAWFLTVREPGVRENPFWTIVRIALRLAATVSALAIPCILAGAFGDSPGLVVGGVAMLLAVPLHMFLFIFYLRKLAARLPNQAMAISCIVVMIALPASLGMIVLSAFSAALSASGGGAAASPAIPAAAGVGFWVMGLSLWAYISILFWFNRSFS